MKKHYLAYIVVIISMISACEKEVTPDLEEVPPFLVVDAWLTQTADTQRITLSYTRPYFDNTSAVPATSATVTVAEAETQRLFSFTDANYDGVYEWAPAPGERFGKVGMIYGLQIELDGNVYQSISRMDSVPSVDSITFEYYKSDAFIRDDYYLGEFWARDLPGAGNTYWIKAFINGEPLDGPDEINTAYDAGFSSGGEVDSLIFIQPIRIAINNFDLEDDDGNSLSPYLPGDTAYVEIHSITNEAWFFLNRVANETNRPGGFAELFADPLANVPTNIVPSNENVRVTGFFNVASVSSLQVIVSEENIRDNRPN